MDKGQIPVIGKKHLWNDKKKDGHPLGKMGKGYE